MNIGFDLDEVIGKTAHMAVNHLNDVFDTNYTIDVFKNFYFHENVFSDDETEQKAIVETLEWAVFDAKMMDSVQPYEDAVKVINDLKHQGHKIYIITKRHKELTASTIKWLKRHKIKHTKLICTDLKEKSYFASQLRLDCFVDDLEENLLDMYKAQTRWRKGLLLMTRPWNEGHYIDTSKMSRANNWIDIRKYLSLGNRLK